jgi:hypothetical protein
MAFLRITTFRCRYGRNISCCHTHKRNKRMPLNRSEFQSDKKKQNVTFLWAVPTPHCFESLHVSATTQTLHLSSHKSTCHSFTFPRVSTTLQPVPHVREVIYISNATTCPSWTSWSPFRLLRLGRPWGGYVVSMRWMVKYKYGVPGGALNINSTNYPDHGHNGDPPLSGKNLLGRAGNLTRDFIISSQKRWPFDHEAGREVIYRKL